MPAFIVRKRLTGTASQGGALGASSVMIHAANAEQARTQGAAQLGRATHEVTVDAYENDTSHLAVQTKPGYEFDPDDVEIVYPEGTAGKFEDVVGD